MNVVDRFADTFDAFLRCIPAVRDGNADAIHDARVATRRLRVMIPLIDEIAPQQEWKETDRLVKRAARALGKARDADVTLALAAEIDARAPLFAPALAPLRSDLLREQLARHRKLVRRIDSLSFEPVQELLARHRRRLWARTADTGRILPAALVKHASRVREAIDRASGVYFAARAHTTRIEIKKLRYLLELSKDGDAQRAGLKLLRKAQEALGRIRDREVLLDRLRGAELALADASAAGDALARVLEAEIRTFYSKYLAARGDVLGLCEAVLASATAARTRRLRQRMLTVGVAVPSAVVLLAAHGRR
jgi:CHAD domain-containing protein